MKLLSRGSLLQNLLRGANRPVMMNQTRVPDRRARLRIACAGLAAVGVVDADGSVQDSRLRVCKLKVSSHEARVIREYRQVPRPPQQWFLLHQLNIPRKVLWCSL